MMTMITANTDFKLHTVVIQICVITGDHNSALITNRQKLLY